MMKQKLRLITFSVLCACAFFIFSTPLLAQELNIDLPQTLTASDSDLIEADKTTHDTIRMTPDKSELVRLDEDAASIIVGNPAHINVVADSSKRLVIVPRLPGATHFVVLDKNGQVLMQRHVIVASPKDGYVRVKRMCAGDAENCQGTSVFYCPDMCHEIGINDQDASSQGDAASGDATAANQMNNGNGAPPASQGTAFE